MSETIEIRARKLADPGVGTGAYYHTYVAYKDKNGKEYTASCFPTRDVFDGPTIASGVSLGASGVGAGPLNKPWGWLSTYSGEFLKGNPEYGVPYQYSEVLEAGSNLKKLWRGIVSAYANISDNTIIYDPIGNNSNACTGSVLRKNGLNVELPDEIWAPGFEDDLDVNGLNGYSVAQAGNHLQHPMNRQSDSRSGRILSGGDSTEGSFERKRLRPLF